eukprot:g80821.t1
MHSQLQTKPLLYQYHAHNDTPSLLNVKNAWTNHSAKGQASSGQADVLVDEMGSKAAARRLKACGSACPRDGR